MATRSFASLSTGRSATSIAAARLAPSSNAASATLMRLVPGLSPAGLDNERHRELAMGCAGALHDCLDDLSRVFDLGFVGLEQQLVMNLQEHAGVQLFAGNGCGNAGHRAFDDVG